MSAVVIAGGGPAGSATALALVRAGIDVTIVERAEFPRRKVCGEYLNSGAVAVLDDLGLGEKVRAIAQPLRGIRLVPPRAASLELPFPRTALACARADLDAMLLEAARDAGARVVHARVEEVAFENDRAVGLIVRDESGERRTLQAQTIVGADGSGSLVAKKLGLTQATRGTRRFAVGGHYSGFGDLDGYVEMYVGTGAYFAINPLDAARANVMVVVPDHALAQWSSDVDEGVRGKAADLGRGHRSFADTALIGSRVSVGPLAHRVRAPSAPGALLVGDAAGFLNPFTGQGVFLALSGAARASAAIVRAFERRDEEDAAFAAYADWRTGDFRARKRLSQLVNLMIDVPPLAQRAVNRLRRLPDLGTTLIDALAGARAPQTAFHPLVLGRLLV